VEVVEANKNLRWGGFMSGFALLALFIYEATPSTKKGRPMNPSYLANLHSMRDAFTWLQLVQEDQESDDEFAANLVRVLQGYLAELRCRLGLLEPYANDLDRISLVKEVSRHIDPIFDAIADRAESVDDVPLAARALCRYLSIVSIDLGHTVWALEAAYPHLAAPFALERSLYQAAREAEAQ
jgi:hypothetical protein